MNNTWRSIHSFRVSAGRADYLSIAYTFIYLIVLLQLFIVIRYGYYLAQYGTLTLTSGSEELNIYAFYKILNGHALY